MKISILVLFFFCLLLPFNTRASKHLIEATFIQPYLVEQWDDIRWKQEFKVLKSAGMEYVIFMHTVHTDQKGNTTAFILLLYRVYWVTRTIYLKTACAMLVGQDLKYS